MLVFNKLLEPIELILNDLETARAKHHNEKLSWSEFIKVLIYHFSIRSDSRNSLAVHLANAEPSLNLPALAVATISDAFRRFDHQLALDALKQLLTRLDIPEIPELRLLGSIFLVDGSYFRLPHLTWWQSRWVQGVQLQLQFDLNHFSPVHFILDGDGGSERAHLTKFLEPNALFVLDRGYMSFKLFRSVEEQQAFVVLRATNNLVTKLYEELPIIIPSSFSNVWSDVRDRRVTSDHKDAKGLIFRLVEFKIGDTSYKLITNHLKLTTFEIILLYAYRWQIEILFRYLKHTMQSLHPITESVRGLQTYFAVLFISALLHMRLNFDSLQADAQLASDIDQASEEPALVIVATAKEAATNPKKNALFCPILTVSSVYGVLPNTGSLL